MTAPSIDDDAARDPYTLWCAFHRLTPGEQLDFLQGHTGEKIEMTLVTYLCSMERAAMQGSEADEEGEADESTQIHLERWSRSLRKWRERIARREEQEA